MKRLPSRFAPCLFAVAAATFGCSLAARAASIVQGFNGFPVHQLDPGDYTITAAPLDGNSPAFIPNTVEYTGIPGPYSAFAAASGVAAFDDYTSVPDAGVNYPLGAFKFVGGVTSGPINAVNCEFDFFDSSTNFVTAVTITIPQLGDFIWTITVNDPSLVIIPGTGFMQDTIAPANTGRWFFTTTPPTIGANSVLVGTGSNLTPPRNNAFELTSAPEPTALALLGIGGALSVARRRR